MLDVLVRGGNVVVPGAGVLRADVGIRDGLIVCLSQTDAAAPPARRVIDAGGLYVVPGIVDPHAHLGIFGPLEVEIQTETAQALAGGVTTVGVYLNVRGRYDQLLAEYARLSAPGTRRGPWCDLFFHLVLNDDAQLVEVARYVRQYGVTSYKVYMAGIPGIIDPVDDGFVLAALAATARRYPGHAPLRLCVHAEDHSVVQRSVAAASRESAATYQAGTPAGELAEWERANPSFAEAHAILRLASLVRQAGSSAYVVHVSSEAGVQAIRRARAEGACLYAETTSPYLALACDEVPGDRRLKMVPPVRTARDREALWKAVADGTIDAIGTDNTTLTAAEKRLDASAIWQVVPGYPVYPVHSALLWDRFLSRDDVELARLVHCLSQGPAQIFGLRGKGNLLPGYDADLAIVDLTRAEKAVARYTRSDIVLTERPLLGSVVYTIKGGRVVVQGGKLLADEPTGTILRR